MIIILSVILLLAVLISIILGVEDLRIGATLITLVLISSLLFMGAGYKAGYKAGQIDAINGKVCFELIERDSTKISYGEYRYREAKEKNHDK
jgi:hypothetical protein